MVIVIRGRCARCAALALLLGSVAVAAVCSSAGDVRAAPAVKGTPPATAEIVDAAIRAVKPALVKLDVVEVNYSGGREEKSETAGSGVIITPEGHVITNHHVAGNAKRIVCTLADKEEIEAELVGTDPLSDIAVIKLKPKEPKVFPVASFGDSSELKPGDQVLAMGSPLAFSQSVTMGIVANNELVMPDDSWYYRITLEGEDVGSIVRWIAHDAPIYGGNSGGPLVNLQGKVVGINELRMGLGAAIPADLAREIAAQLIEHGEVTRSWIGLEVQPRLRDRAPQRGVLVSGTITGSSADKAGFRPGDVLIRLAGQDVNVQFREEMAALNRLVFGLPVGKEVQAVVLRNGEEVALRVRTEKREKVAPKERELKQWGMCARDLSLMTVKEMQLDSRDGVLVTSVRPGGPCGDARPAIGERDAIVRVGDTPIKTLSDLIEVTNRITEGTKRPVPTLVAYVRRGEHYLTVVKVGIKELDDPGREVRKAWLPVAFQVLTRELAENLGMPDRTGVRVTQVYPDSTAEKAALEVGDIIVGLNGEDIPAAEARDVEVLPAMVRRLTPGSTAEFTIIRNGEQRTVPVELALSPMVAREMKRYRDEDFEFTARELTFLDRIEQRWPQDQRGALVQEAREGGWAAIAGLSAGDLITEAEGIPIADVEALEATMKQVARDRPQSVVLQVRRGIHRLYLDMRPAWPESGK
ncbi:MAG: PDZ domain-containing protein [Armatimonadota bacterium]|nr:MAG: PDZ domain-containing protein [Armatimonadota bacterium]